MITLFLAIIFVSSEVGINQAEKLGEIYGCSHGNISSIWWRTYFYSYWDPSADRLYLLLNYTEKYPSTANSLLDVIYDVPQDTVPCNNTNCSVPFYGHDEVRAFLTPYEIHDEGDEEGHSFYHYDDSFDFMAGYKHNLMLRIYWDDGKIIGLIPGHDICLENTTSQGTIYHLCNSEDAMHRACDDIYMKDEEISGYATKATESSTMLSSTSQLMEKSTQIDTQVPTNTTQKRKTLMPLWNIPTQYPLDSVSSTTTERVTVPINNGPCGVGSRIDRAYCIITKGHFNSSSNNMYLLVSDINDDVQRNYTLSPVELYEASVIVDTVCQMPHQFENLTTKVIELIDNLLTVPYEIFLKSNDNRDESTSMKLLKSTYRCSYNSVNMITFLFGKNIAIVKRIVSCNVRRWPKLIEHNTKFILTDSLNHKWDRFHCSVSVASNTICDWNLQNKNSSNDFVLLYMIVRNYKFYSGNSTHSPNIRIQPNDFYPTVDAVHENACKVGNYTINGRVIGVRIINISSESAIESLTQDGTQQILGRINFMKSEMLMPLHGQITMGKWGANNWSLLEYDMNIKNDMYEIEIKYFADYTLLVNGLESDPTVCDSALTFIRKFFGYISICVVLCLNTAILLICLYKFLPNLFPGWSASYLLHYQELRLTQLFHYISLSAFHVSLTFLSESPDAYANLDCDLIATFNYWFLLCCIFSTTFQTLRIVRKLFDSPLYSRNIFAFWLDILMGIFLAIGIPLICSMFFYITQREFYTRSDYTCWIRSDHTLGAVVIPLSGLIFQIVIILTVMTPPLCNLFLNNERKLLRFELNNVKFGQRIQTMFLLTFLQMILGMPLFFQYLTVPSPSLTTWHYLSSVCNSALGVTILLILLKRLYSIRHLKVNRRKRVNCNSLDIISTYGTSQSSVDSSDLAQKPISKM